MLGGRETFPGKRGDTMNYLQLHFTSVLVLETVFDHRSENKGLHFLSSETRTLSDSRQADTHVAEQSMKRMFSIISC